MEMFKVPVRSFNGVTPSLGSNEKNIYREIRVFINGHTSRIITAERDRKWKGGRENYASLRCTFALRFIPRTHANSDTRRFSELSGLWFGVGTNEA